MSGVRAQWFVDELVDAEDPFVGPVEEVGESVDLRSEPDLLARLLDLVRAEEDHWVAGTRCIVRHCASSVCSACPISQVAGKDDMADLCRNGVEQELVLTTLNIAKVRRDSRSS